MRLRLLKAEIAAIREDFEFRRSFGNEAWDHLSPAQAKKAKEVRETLLSKLDTAEVAPRKKSGGLAVAVAIEAFRGVLGRRLVLPPGRPGAGWYAQMGNRLAALGMTEELCRAAAMQAGLEWSGPIKAESIIRQADKLIHNYQSDGATEPSGGWQGAGNGHVDLDAEEL